MDQSLFIIMMYTMLLSFGSILVPTSHYCHYYWWCDRTMFLYSEGVMGIVVIIIVITVMVMVVVMIVSTRVFHGQLVNIY